MAQRETPEEWRVLMDRRGISSARALADRAGISVQAVLRLMHRDSEPQEGSVVAVAQALEVDPRRIRELVRVPSGEGDPFVLPPEANRLNRRQRAAILEIVRVLLESSTGSVVPMSAAAGRPSATERRGLKVAAKREKDPDDGGPG